MTGDLLARHLGSEDAARRWRECNAALREAERQAWMRQGAARDRAYAEAGRPPQPSRPVPPPPDPRLEQLAAVLRLLTLNLMLQLLPSQREQLGKQIETLARECLDGEFPG